MSTPTLSELTPATAARLMGSYAKQFSAGAFGAPLARDIKPRELWSWRGEGHEATVAIIKHTTKPMVRTDWTGRRYTIPAGVNVVTNIGRTPNGPLPFYITHQPYVFAYVEDRPLTEHLENAGKLPIATRISATSEIIACWGPADQHHSEDRADLTTAKRFGPLDFHPIPDTLRAAALTELEAIDAWHDDYPYYSDGTWGAVSLRGFYPDQPHLGTKPAEMPRKWQDERPGCLDLRCEWTTLADRTPALRALVDSITWIDHLERVRLMRMAGRRGRPGHLGRHSDVTDRNAGTRTGQIARFHLPLVTHPAIKMSVWELDGTRRDLHLDPWSLWYLDARKPHAVTNPTGTDRVHLVIDAIVNPDLRQRL